METSMVMGVSWLETENENMNMANMLADDTPGLVRIHVVADDL
jgi:hypothetical protein